MQAYEVRTWTTEELQGRLEDAYREIYALRHEKASGRLEDHNRIKTAKRDIARIRTILRERELSAELIGGGEA
ncbi:MAG: 50S ribosomal protein L29 [Chloroflexi bacterium]|jgi:large subunit ribosomal protein L29|nr:50S ribosomal protein L29 [Chloroflexota bacterium]